MSRLLFTSFLSRAVVLALPLAAALAAPAAATTMPAADLQPGHTLGLGLAGASYDYAWKRFSLGAAVVSDFGTSAVLQHLVPGVRAQGRFIEDANFDASVIAGVALDPGTAGSRAYVVPDLGLGVAYHTVIAGFPMALRLDLTLTVDQGQGTAGTIVPTTTSFQNGFVSSPVSQPTLLQRIIFGPNTGLGLGVTLGDRLEVDLGGGTLIGFRYRY